MPKFFHRDCIARQFGGDQPVAEDEHAGAHGRDFLEVGGDHHQRGAGLRALAQHAIDLPLGADIDAGRGLLEHHERLVQVEPARQHHLLLVAARELLHLGRRRGRIDVEAADQCERAVVLATGTVEGQAAIAMQRGVGEQVLQHRHRAGEVFFEPLPGDIGHARANGIGGAGEIAFSAEQLHPPRGQRLTPEDRAADGLVPCAAQADEAQHFAAVHREAQRAGIAAGRAIQLQHRHACCRNVRLGHRGRERLADDQADQLAFVGVRRGLHRHQLAVAHHGCAVGDGHHFVEPVRHVEHRHALPAQFAQHAEHALHITHRQAGRGLVEHQQARLDFERTADGEQRFLGPREREHAAAGVDVAAHARHHAACGVVRGGPVDEPEAARVAGAEAHVLGHGHPFDKAQVLVNEGDGLLASVGAPPGGLRLAVEKNLALVRGIDAREQLDERGFARAVLAEQREDFAGAHIERHVVHGLRAAEAFAEGLELQEGRAHGQVAPRVWRRMR